MEATAGSLQKQLIWLEPDYLHYHPGLVQAKALWGRMMRRESGADTRTWTGYAVDPSGSTLDADIGPGGDDYNRIAFFASAEGIYDLVLESESVAGGERLLRKARLPVPVGHDVQGRPGSAGPEGLEVYCEEYRDYGLGKAVTLRVTMDGRPLPGAVVKATYHFFEGKDYPWQGEAGEDGRVNFTFFEKGHWLFTCTWSDPSLSKPGEYERTVYISSVTVPGVR